MLIAQTHVGQYHSELQLDHDQTGKKESSTSKLLSPVSFLWWNIFLTLARSRKFPPVSLLWPKMCLSTPSSPLNLWSTSLPIPRPSIPTFIHQGGNWLSRSSPVFTFYVPCTLLEQLQKLKCPFFGMNVPFGGRCGVVGVRGETKIVPRAASGLAPTHRLSLKEGELEDSSWRSAAQEKLLPLLLLAFPGHFACESKLR